MNAPIYGLHKCTSLTPCFPYTECQSRVFSQCKAGLKKCLSFSEGCLSVHVGNNVIVVVTFISAIS